MLARRATNVAGRLLQTLECFTRERAAAFGNVESCLHVRYQCRRVGVSPGLLGVTEMEMPALSPTMEAGNIAEWKVQEGQSFAAGDVLAEIETDKATMAWESQEDGVLGKILVGAGSKDVAVGTVVALSVDDEGELGAVEKHDVGGSGSGSASAAAGAAGERAPQDAPPSRPPSNHAFPEHQVWTMPALSPTMEAGNIAKWQKQIGDEVAPGDGLVEVETDKATMMWESVEEGFIAKILAPDGAQDVPVGEPVVVIVGDADLVPAFASYSIADAQSGGDAVPGTASQPEPAAASQPHGSSVGASSAGAAPPTAASAPAARSASGDRVVASPRARKLARDAGVSLTQVSGSGPRGRVVAADVEKARSQGQDAAAGQPTSAGSAPADAASAFADVPVSQIKKVTARRLLESKTTVPHYYLTIDCAIDEMLSMRSALNAALEKSQRKLSVNDFVVKASAAALKDVPQVNAAWHGDFIREFENVDISVAVQTPIGLMVPVVRDADLKGLATVSDEVKSLAGKAKEGRLKPDEYSGGTFTVSNLGMFGVRSFSAIINPPQAAILACGGTEKRVTLGKDGAPKVVSVMTVTLSCDHRVVDGAVGATWLQAFKGYLENPETLLL